MWNCDLNVAQAPQKSFIICQPNFIEKKAAKKSKTTKHSSCVHFVRQNKFWNIDTFIYKGKYYLVGRV